MARAYRLSLLLACWLLLGAQAWAFPPVSDNGCTSGTCTQYSALWRTCATTPAGGASCNVYVSTQLAACQALISKRLYGDSVGTVVTSATFNGAACSGTVTGGYSFSNVAPVSRTVTPTQTCPANSTLSGGECVCTGATAYSTGLSQCVSQLEKDCKDRQGAGSGTLEVDGGLVSAGGGGSPSTFCDTTAGTTGDTAAGMGCTVANTVLDVGFQSGQPPRYKYRMRGTFSGTACTQNPAVTASPSTTPINTPTVATAPVEKPKCPGGIVQVVNGLETCISFKDYLTQTTTNTVDGTVTTAADGTKTEVSNATNTSCANNVCTSTTVTTTVTKNSAGTVTGTATSAPAISTEGKGEYCAANPNSSQCGGAGQGGDGKGDGSAFGGSCTAGFQCDGDAAICAIAKASNDTKCLLDASTATEKAVYDSAVSAGTATGIQTATTEINAASFDQSNALGTAASCIPDQAITVSGVSVTVPFSSICPHLAILGNLMLAVSFLTAMFIVGRPT